MWLASYLLSLFLERKEFLEVPLTKQWHIDGKTVLEIQIEPSNKKPHFAKDENGKWLAYVRIADENFLAHKIQIEVWRKLKNKQGIHFSYSNDEQFLIDYLQNNSSISFSKLMRLAHISRKKAEEVLSNFVVMKVINLNSQKEGTTFSLNEDFYNLGYSTNHKPKLPI